MSISRIGKYISVGSAACLCAVMSCSTCFDDVMKSEVDEYFGASPGLRADHYDNLHMFVCLMKKAGIAPLRGPGNTLRICAWYPDRWPGRMLVYCHDDPGGIREAASVIAKHPNVVGDSPITGQFWLAEVSVKGSYAVAFWNNMSDPGIRDILVKYANLGDAR